LNATEIVTDDDHSLVLVWLEAKVRVVGCTMMFAYYYVLLLLLL